MRAHPHREPPRRTTWRALTPLAITACLVASAQATAPTGALWSDRAEVAAQVRTGITALIVSDDKEDLSQEVINARLEKNEDYTKYVFPQSVTDSLAATGEASIGIFVDARQEGRRGMSVWISNVTGSDLARLATAHVFLVPLTQDCADPGIYSASDVTQLYKGSLSAFSEGPGQQRSIVSTEYGVGDDTNSNGRQRYCVTFFADLDTKFAGPTTMTFSYATYDKRQP